MLKSIILSFLWLCPKLSANENGVKNLIRINTPDWGIKIIRLSFASIFSILIPFTSPAQYKLDEDLSFVYVNGTSTLHNWTAVAEQMKGELKADVEAGYIKKLDAAQIVIQTISLKSGKEDMDKKMHQAMKSDQFPEINYQLKNHTMHSAEITVKGELTIAGVTKMIETKVVHKPVGKHIEVNGEIKFNMSDFNIKPPKILLGALKTGNEVIVTFYFMFCNEI